jgi:hypothetical protein
LTGLAEFGVRSIYNLDIIRLKWLIEELDRPLHCIYAHVRRLEALRRAGIVERASADCWLILEDFEVRTTAYDAGRGRTTSIRLLSARDLDQQVKSDGATWLDRRLAGRDKSPLVMSGFGIEVREALDRRADELIRQGHASRTIDGCCATIWVRKQRQSGWELAVAA